MSLTSGAAGDHPMLHSALCEQQHYPERTGIRPQNEQ
jgi:hypothetical protein